MNQRLIMSFFDQRKWYPGVKNLEFFNFIQLLLFKNSLSKLAKRFQMLYERQLQHAASTQFNKFPVSLPNFLKIIADNKIQ